MVGSNNKSATPEVAANRLIKRHGPFICLGDDWWHWNGYIWREVDPKFYRKHATEIQSAGQRSSKYANEVLALVNAKCQHHPEETKWRYGVGFKDDNTVMVNVKNGVVRVHLADERMELIDPDPEHLAAAQFPVKFEPDAECPVFAGLLRTALLDRMDRYLLQCYAGYCLLPDYRFQCVMLCQGPPNSGKSLLI